jgi:putative hemolysin
MIPQGKIITLVLLVLLSGFFSGVEIALFSLSNLRVKHLVEKKVHGAKMVERLKAKPQRLLITILVGNNVVNIGASALATSIVYEISRSHAVSITTGVMTLIILIFGEITPKTLAARYNQQIALLVARPLHLMQTIFYPIVFLFEGLANLFTRLTKQEKKPLVTEEEIKTFVSVAEKAGEIKDIEKEMVHQVLRLNEVEAKDVMTPRNKIVAVSADSKTTEIAARFHSQGYSRLPVYTESLDQIRGFVHIVDVQKAMVNRDDRAVASIMRPILFVPASQKLDSLLKFLQRRKQHIAVVVDHFGTNIGVVTMEDILEEIVGEIADETEKSEPLIRRISRKSYLVQGRAEIDEINNECKLNLPKDRGPSAISSYILEQIGGIPREGDLIDLPQCRIKIKSMKGNSIDTVVITPKR